MGQGANELSIEELKALARERSLDIQTLERILRYLNGRVSEPARRLRGEVIQRLGELYLTSSAVSNATRIRPLGTKALPASPLEKLSTELKLHIAEDASYPQRYVIALDALIEECSKAPKRKFREVRNGERLPKAGQSTLYRFELSDSGNLSDDTKIDLEVGTKCIPGTLISARLNTATVALDRDLGAHIEKARLLLADTVLLGQLREQVSAASKGAFEFNRALADAAVGGSTSLPAIARIPNPKSGAKLNPSQTKALCCVLSQALTFIWGPPGCGKTYTLAEIVRTAFEAGERVLICSNTNKAVDQVLYRICELLGIDHPAIEAGHILRLGRIADDKLAAEFGDAISEEAIIERVTRDLTAEIARLEEILIPVAETIDVSVSVLEAFGRLDEAAQRVISLEQQARNIAARREDLQQAAATCDSRLIALADELSRARGVMRVFRRDPESIRKDIAMKRDERAAITNAQTKAKAIENEALNNLNEARADQQHLASELCEWDRAAVEKDLTAAQGEFQELNAEIRSLQEKVAQVHVKVVQEAVVLGATGARACKSVKEIGSVALVIVDEASMLLLPMVWFVVGMSRRRAVLCGDFRQIPPIIETQEQAILKVIGDDVFRASGVAGLRSADTRLVMLDMQRRMEDEICKLISVPMYGGRLRTDPDPALWAARRSRPRPPAPFENVLTLVDTSSLRPFQAFDDSGSRLNIVHAALVRSIVWHIANSEYTSGTPDLAVCTPYAAQRKLICQLLEGSELGDVPVGTVHSFQGDERNAIIFDIPEGEGGGKLGRFVCGTPPEDVSARLINVAVSRAQGHLIVVANLACLDRLLPSRALLRGILFDMQTRGRVLQARHLLTLGPLENDLQGLGEVQISDSARALGLFDQNDFDRAFVADIGRAADKVAIFSGFVSHHRVRELMGLLHDKTHAGVKVRCVSKPPHCNSRAHPESGKKAFDELEAAGCAVDGRARIHEKVVIVDSNIVWHGSLNPLSYSQRTDELMIRVVGSGFAQLVASMLARTAVPAARVLEVLTDPENPRCKDCGSRSYLDGDHRNERFYCEDRCGWSEPLSLSRRASKDTLPEVNIEDLPAAGLPCPICGRPTKKRNGAFGVFYGCSNYPRCKGTWSLKAMALQIARDE